MGMTLERAPSSLRDQIGGLQQLATARKKTVKECLAPPSHHHLSNVEISFCVHHWISDFQFQSRESSYNMTEQTCSQMPRSSHFFPTGLISPKSVLIPFCKGALPLTPQGWVNVWDMEPGERLSSTHLGDGKTTQMVLKIGRMLLLRLEGSNRALMPLRLPQSWILQLLWNGSPKRSWQFCTWQSRITEKLMSTETFSIPVGGCKHLPKHSLETQIVEAIWQYQVLKFQ